MHYQFLAPDLFGFGPLYRFNNLCSERAIDILKQAPSNISASTGLDEYLYNVIFRYKIWFAHGYFLNLVGSLECTCVQPGRASRENISNLGEFGYIFSTSI